MNRLGIVLAECSWIAMNDAEQIARCGQLIETSRFPPAETPMTEESRAEYARLSVLSRRLAYRAREEGVTLQGIAALFGGEDEP